MNGIVLRKGPYSWMCQHTGPHAQHVRDTFGTDTLPAPFDSCVPADEVIRCLQSIPYNRNVRITVEEALPQSEAEKLCSTDTEGT